MDHPFENLRLQAETETAERKTSRRPTWAPALVVDGELLENCIALGRLKETDKPVARLWAIYADPKRRGQVVREKFSTEPLPGHSCRGFELRAGTTHSGDVIWRTQKSTSGDWRDGPRWTDGPVEHWKSRLQNVQQNYQSSREWYENPTGWLAKESAEFVAERAAHLDRESLPRIEELTAKLQAAETRYSLLCRSFELGAQRVASFVGDVEGERRAGAQLTGTCAICGRGLTDPVSVERGIGPECIQHIMIRDPATSQFLPWRLSA